MYEVEWKVELTEQQKADYISELSKAGFVSKGVTPQNDYYIEATDSPYGGLNLKRYRREGDEYIYTEKIWEMIGDTKARKENERTVTKEEFEAETAKYPDAVKVIKDREWFEGSYKGKDVSITIDSAKFDHSPSMRYFTEAEIGVTDKAEVEATKTFIKRCLMDLLQRPEGIPEAPGMLTMALKKL